MYVSFNPNISFKQGQVAFQKPAEGAAQGTQGVQGATQGDATTQGIVQGVQGTPVTAQTDTNIPQQPVIAAEKQPEKRSGLREDISKIAKFFTTLGEMTKASVKAVGYGTLTVGASLLGFWTFGAVPRGFKNGNNIIDAFKHPIKNISKKGKVITALLGLGVASYHLIKGKLIANQRTANVDHQLKTGHRPA